MTDSRTQQQLKVLDGGEGGPYMIVPASQLPQVRQQLDNNKVWYWVSSTVISLDGKPPVGFINFGRSGDAAKIQAILDDAA